MPLTMFLVLLAITTCCLAQTTTLIEEETTAIATTTAPETTFPPETTQPGTSTSVSAQASSTTSIHATTSAPSEQCAYEDFSSETNVETLVFLEDVFLNDGNFVATLVVPSKAFELDLVAVGQTTLEASGSSEEIDDCWRRLTVSGPWNDVRNETDSVDVWLRDDDSTERVSVLVDSLLVQTMPDELAGRQLWARQSAVFDFHKRLNASTEIDLTIPESLGFFADILVLDHSVRFDQDTLESIVQVRLATFIAHPYQLDLLDWNSMPEMEINIDESSGCATDDNEACVQQISLSFNPANCTMTEAAIRLFYELKCQEDTGNQTTNQPCEIPTFPGGGNFPSIPVRINFRSGMDLCPLMRTSNTAKPKLAVFSDESRSDELEDGEFSGENPLYFLASVEDNVDPYDVQISNIRMIKPNGDVILVWDGGDSSVQDFQIDQKPQMPSAEFSFLPSNPPFDLFGQYYMTADLDVTYVPGGEGNNSMLLEHGPQKLVVGRGLFKQLAQVAENEVDAAGKLRTWRWLVAVVAVGLILA